MTARNVLATTQQPSLVSTADGVNEVATVRQLVGTNTARAWSAVLWEAHWWRVTCPTTASTPVSTTPQSTMFIPLTIEQDHPRGTPCPCCCSLRLSRTYLLLFLFPPGHAGPHTARSPASSPPRCPLPFTVNLYGSALQSDRGQYPLGADRSARSRVRAATHRAGRRLSQENSQTGLYRTYREAAPLDAPLLGPLAATPSHPIRRPHPPRDAWTHLRTATRPK